MAFSCKIPCIVQNFATLPVSTLQAIDDAITTAKAALTLESLAVAAQQFALSLVLVPLKAEVAAAQDLVASTTNAVNIFPNSVVLGCLEIGQLSTTLNQIFITTTQFISEKLSDLQSALALDQEYSDTVTTIEVLQKFLSNVQDCVQAALSSETATNQGANIGPIIGGTS